VVQEILSLAVFIAAASVDNPGHQRNKLPGWPGCDENLPRVTRPAPEVMLSWACHAGSCQYAQLVLSGLCGVGRTCGAHRRPAWARDGAAGLAGPWAAPPGLAGRPARPTGLAGSAGRATGVGEARLLPGCSSLPAGLELASPARLDIPRAPRPDGSALPAQLERASLPAGQTAGPSARLAGWTGRSCGSGSRMRYPGTTATPANGARRSPT
jgi:hypothetical protein